MRATIRLSRNSGRPGGGVAGLGIGISATTESAYFGHWNVGINRPARPAERVSKF